MSWIKGKGVALITIMLLLLFTSCSEGKAKRFEEERFLFGTHIKMIVYAKDKKAADKAMNAAFGEMERIDRKFNSKDNTSIIYQLNNSVDKKAKLDDEGIYLFEKVNEAYNLSGGKYDITIYPLLEAWGFLDEDSEKIPTSEEIAEAKKLIGYENVKLENGELSLHLPIKEIDTGSFLKGYAVERGKETLEKEGIKSGFVSALSSISTIGVKPDGTPWRIGVQDPTSPEEFLGIVELNGESMGVSGDYQTYVEIDGKRYHHIIDKETGYPVTDKKMVVIISDNGLDTDLLSTAFFVMPTEKVLDYAKNKKGMKVLIVNEDMSNSMTDNFKLITK